MKFKNSQFSSLSNEIILSPEYMKKYQKLIDEINDPTSQFYSQTLQKLSTLKVYNIIE